MRSCDRFEAEAILRLEQGLPLEEHFAICSDCVAARAAYDRLCREIAILGEEYQLPSGWQDRVWGTLERQREQRHWWRLPAALVPVGLAATFCMFLLTRALVQAPALVTLSAEVQAGNAVTRRGREAKPGDRLVVRATTGGARYVELRLYRNDAELIVRCSDLPPCVLQGDTLRASLALEAAGVYKVLLLTSEHPLPHATSDLDGDTNAALATGVEIELGPEIIVR